MASMDLEQRVQELQCELTPAFVRARVSELLRQGEDVGGGVNATRLVRYLVGDLARRNIELTWAYDRLKPALRVALAQIPELHYFEGD
jgi:hypothetical protein